MYSFEQKYTESQRDILGLSEFSRYLLYVLHPLVNTLGIEVCKKLNINSPNLLNLIRDTCINQTRINFLMRSEAVSYGGTQVPTGNYTHYSILLGITESFTTEDIVNHPELIIDCFLIKNFIERDDFNNEVFQRIKNYVLENPEASVRLSYDFSIFAPKALKELNPDFPWFNFNA
jgi:hypothetical protein